MYKSALTLILLIFLFHKSFSQKPFLGVDIGFLQGKSQYFETGINLGLQTKGDLFIDLSTGIEDDLNAKLTGYKIGFTACNLKENTLPLGLGISGIRYFHNKTSLNSIRPEVGLIVNHKHGRGRSVMKLFYGYNISDTDLNKYISKHQVRLSFNTNWRSFIDLFTFYPFT